MRDVHFGYVICASLVPQQSLLRRNMLVLASYFSAFRRGLSLRYGQRPPGPLGHRYFLAFRRGLSLRRRLFRTHRADPDGISPPSGGDFVTTLDVNREVSRGLCSPGLETNPVSRPGLFFSKHEDTLYVPPTADSSCQLSESEMTKSDARNL